MFGSSDVCNEGDIPVKGCMGGSVAPPGASFSSTRAGNFLTASTFETTIQDSIFAFLTHIKSFPVSTSEVNKGSEQLTWPHTHAHTPRGRVRDTEASCFFQVLAD